MANLQIFKESPAQAAVDDVMSDIEKRLFVSPFGNCHVNLVASILKMCHAQSCGKCVPCRIGLSQLSNILEDILNGRAGTNSLDLLERTALAIYESADCAIGYEAAGTVIKSLRNFRDDYENHVAHGKCSPDEGGSVPCVNRCPAHVDVPGYIALVESGRYADAVRLIRKDNPFPSACGLICEHPCETRCRRNVLDIGINIRGIKRFAVDNCGGAVPVPPSAPQTGKKVAVIGGGPAGLSAAYFLQLMGHAVTIYEKRNYLGGMLRYGIPSYRLPRGSLQWDIDAILSTGVEIRLGTDIGGEISLDGLHRQYDAMFIAIGAHTEKRLGLEGENLRGVISAVHMLRAIGDGKVPDFKGKRVVVIGGGNVAMDVARSSVRLGAAQVSVAYRRRQNDMTALPEEIEGAIAEGCEILDLQAPVALEGDSEDNLVALITQPQLIGPIEDTIGDDRPKPVNADKPRERIPCDIVILAVGQDIEADSFVRFGLKAKRNIFQTRLSTSIEGMPGVFAGGDCATGPATVIRAVEAGKVAAANIDNYLGFDHKISVDVAIPKPCLVNKKYWGRVNMREKEASERKDNFDIMEAGMSREEAVQETGRCLRCDHYGYGSFRGGRNAQW
ncbi:glutamate synthase [Betaproteobacteria bacterium]|nr:glutamate synthase [Betaproteobacteria bacterium]